MLFMIGVIVLLLVVSFFGTLTGVGFWMMALYTIGPVVLLCITYKIAASPIIESLIVGVIATAYIALMLEWHLAICITLGLVVTFVLYALTFFHTSFWIRTAVLSLIETAICISIVKHYTNDLIWIVFFGVIFAVAPFVAHLSERPQRAAAGANQEVAGDEEYTVIDIIDD